MGITTFRYRIKDSNCRPWLKKKAGVINHIWNKAQELKLKEYHENKKWLQYQDLSKIIKISTINSQCVQQTLKQYCKSCITHKKAKLRWRTGKKNLGWIPCTNQNVRIDVDHGTFKFMNKQFKLWYERKIEGKIKTVSLNEDSRGRWYINITCEAGLTGTHGEREIGIDLGCKYKITCSDGEKITRENITKKYGEKLAKAQRAGKKKQTKNIYAKIKNTRLDWSHKTTHYLCSTSKKIIVGDIKSSKLVKNRSLAKSIYDSSFFILKSQLQYKSLRHGVELSLVNEAFSTVTCSVCLARDGPRGLGNLGIREWTCSCCGTTHDRDVNAARNILFSVENIQR